MQHKAILTKHKMLKYVMVIHILIKLHRILFTNILVMA